MMYLNIDTFFLNEEGLFVCTLDDGEFMNTYMTVKYFKEVSVLTKRLIWLITAAVVLTVVCGVLFDIIYNDDTGKYTVVNPIDYKILSPCRHNFLNEINKILNSDVPEYKIIPATDFHWEDLKDYPGRLFAIGEDAEGNTGTLDVVAMWDKEEEKLTITKNGENSTGLMMDFPESGCVYFDISKLKKIEIGDGVVNIGAWVFSGYEYVESVRIPFTVSDIGANAFRSCMSLKSVNIPYGVKVINEYTFADCVSLEEVYIPKTVVEIKPGAFAGCVSLNNMELPDSISHIGNEAFASCRSLTDIKLPASLKTIESGLFYYCSRLKNVDIPDGVESIGDYAFAFCESIKYVYIPYNVETIGEKAFGFCSSLNTVSFSNRAMMSARKLTSGINNYDEVQASRLKIINDYAFSDCSSLISISLPENLMIIGNGVFKGCVSLESVYIISNINLLSREVFANCSSLTTVCLPNTVRTIMSLAFSNCTSLKEIEIPSSVLRIEDNVFDNCVNLHVIRCSIDAKPDGWSDRWNAGCNAIVCWNE